MPKNHLDDSNPYTAGWTRPKMLKALQETLPYLADDELENISSQIRVIQEKRKQVQQSAEQEVVHKTSRAKND
jgi:hypothetical protein